ncbi:hypothetical protein NQ315_002584, partial [Exocentrus adspersus]
EDMAHDELHLTLGAVFSYLTAGPENGCILEGEELLNAKHIILIGTTSVSAACVEILALCLQTSSLKMVQEFQSPILDIIWSNKRKRVNEHEAAPLLETACFESLVAKKKSISVEQEEKCFQLLTNICKGSGLSIHLIPREVLKKVIDQNNGATLYAHWFSKGDLHTKATNYFWPKNFSSRYIEHDLKYEKEALRKYKSCNKYTVAEVGLVISRQYPWLAYSPDGVVMTNGVPTRLLEIKCPYDETDLTLKTNHQYYGQVQLGMAILNLKLCDFILYLVKSESFINVVVTFNEDFARKIICNVTEKYFKYVFHNICEKKIKLYLK